MNVRWAPTAVERAKSVTTCPAATAVTAKPATSTTPFASSVWVCINRHTTNTQPKHTSLFRIASSHKTSLQKWPYKILCNTGGRFSPLALASVTQENWLLTSNTFKFQNFFWSILNHSSKIKHLKGLKKSLDTVTELPKGCRLLCG